MMTGPFTLEKLSMNTRRILRTNYLKSEGGRGKLLIGSPHRIGLIEDETCRINEGENVRPKSCSR